MKTIKQRVQELNHAYLSWYPEENEEAKILQDVLIDALLESNQALMHLMPYHQAEFFHHFPMDAPYRAMSQTGFQIMPSKAVTYASIPKDTLCYVQGEQQLPYRIQNDIQVSAQTMDGCICYDGNKEMVQYYEKPFSSIPLFQKEASTIPYQLDIRFENLFPKGNTMECYLKLVSYEADQLAFTQYLCSEHVSWLVYGDDILLQEVSWKQEEERLYFHKTMMEESYAILRFHAIFHETSCQKDLLNVVMELGNIERPLQQVFVNEVEEECSSFALFDAPLSLFEVCYMRCDEVLLRKGMLSKLTLHMEEDIYLAGRELLEEHEYRLFMRKLPKSQIVYEVFCDLVQLQYFNGEWVKLEDVQLKKEAWEKHKLEIKFQCPNDMMHYQVNGNEAYWLRFLLMKAENCYQLPGNHHIPHLHQISFASIHQKKDAYSPMKVIYFDHGEQRDVLKVWENHLPVHMFQNDYGKQKQLYFYFKEKPEVNELHYYIQMSKEIKQANPVAFYYLNQHGRFHLSVHDDTGGFAHSGCLSFIIPNDIAYVKRFSKSGYWMICEYTNEIHANTIIQMIENYVSATHEQCMVKMMRLPVHKEIKIEVTDLKELYLKEQDTWIKWNLFDDETGRMREAYYNQEQGFLSISLAALLHLSSLQEDVEIKMIICPQIDNVYIAAKTPVLPKRSRMDIERIETVFPITMKQRIENDTEEMKRLAFQIYPHSMLSKHDVKSMLESRFMDIYEAVCIKNQDRYGEKNNEIAVCITLHKEAQPVEEQLLTQIQEYMKQQLPPIMADKLQIYYSIPVMIHLQFYESDGTYEEIKELCQNYLDIHHGNQNHQGWHIGEYPKAQDICSMLKQYNIHVSDCHIQGSFFNKDKDCTKDIQELSKLASGMIQFGSVSLYAKEGNI